jgi:hydrogenase nickel incorporation protein HypB
LAGLTEQVVQINTGMSCHLYANQICESLKDIDLSKGKFLFIENVGNMVCPGEFDLGENVKVVLLSVPEGDDKVAKYPTIFRAADLILLTKSDLLGILPFDLDRVDADIRKLNGQAPVIRYSSKTGEGMEEWLGWLRDTQEKGLGKKAAFITEA